MSTFEHSYQPPSELGQWRARAEYAESELRRIERETAMMAIQRREELQRESDEKARTAQTQRDDAALEEHRRNAWVNHRVDVALASADPDAAMLGLLSRDPATDLPEGIWPPGTSPDDFRTLVASEPPPRDEDAAGTRLGQLLTAKGVAI